jgi:hypothetical protein
MVELQPSKLVTGVQFPSPALTPEQQAEETTALRGPPSVAISAHHLTLRDLGENRIPIAVSDPIRNRERLVLQMVELQNDHVGFSAIDARMFFQKF